LLPSLSQLFVLLVVFAVAAVCVGLGQLVGARRPAIALVAGWGVSCVALVVANTIFGLPLAIGVAALGTIGIVGLVPVAQGSFEEDAWPTTLRVLALAAPFLLIAAAIQPAGPDEFSTWLPNLDYLYRHDHFPDHGTPSLGSIRPAAPYALFFIGYAVSLVVGHLAEGAGIVWNALLLVSVGCLCADIIGAQIERRWLEDYHLRELTPQQAWGVAGAGLLAATTLDPAFVPRFFLSNYDDGVVGSVTGVVAAGTMLWLSAETRKAPEARLLLVVALGFCCAALIQLRQDGLTLFALVFIAAVAATPLERQARRSVTPTMLLLLLPAPLLVALVWREYQAFKIPDEALALLPLAKWHWAELIPAIWSMAGIALSKIGYFAVAGVLVGFAIAATEAPELFTPFQRSGAATGAVLVLGKTITLIVLYLVGDFTDAEVAAAKDFWGFSIQIGPALVACAVPLIPPWLWTEKSAGRLLCIAAPALAVLLPLVSMSYLRVDAPSQSRNPYLRGVADEVAALTKGAPAITLVATDDLATGLSYLLVVRYELQSGRVGPRLGPWSPMPTVQLVAGTPPTLVAADGFLPRDALNGYAEATRTTKLQAALAAPFVWFDNGGSAATALAGVPLDAGASYLVAHHGATSEIVHEWPFPLAR
jgi:hypothetical protein